MDDTPGPALQINTLIKQIFLLSDDLDRRLLLNFGLSTARFNLLKHLAHNGGRLTPGELCLRLLCDKANVTRLLDGLESEELLQRIPDPQDKRRLFIALTPTGSQRLAEADAAYLAAIRTNFSALPAQESTALAALLAQLKIALDERIANSGQQSAP
jgi:DNA-binding MarR family transcriptional regulator